MVPTDNITDLCSRLLSREILGEYSPKLRKFAPRISGLSWFLCVRNKLNIYCVYFAHEIQINEKKKKNALKEKEKDRQVYFSDELNDACICKDLNSFWKKILQNKSVVGYRWHIWSQHDCCEFRYVFKNTRVPNSPDKHSQLSIIRWHLNLPLNLTLTLPYPTLTLALTLTKPNP